MTNDAKTVQRHTFVYDWPLMMHATLTLCDRVQQEMLKGFTQIDVQRESRNLMVTFTKPEE